MLDLLEEPTFNSTTHNLPLIVDEPLVRVNFGNAQSLDDQTGAGPSGALKPSLKVRKPKPVIAQSVPVASSAARAPKVQRLGPPAHLTTSRYVNSFLLDDNTF